MKFADFKIEGPTANAGDLHMSVQVGEFAIFNLTGDFIDTASTREEANAKVNAMVEEYERDQNAKKSHDATEADIPSNAQTEAIFKRAEDVTASIAELRAKDLAKSARPKIKRT